MTDKKVTLNVMTADVGELANSISLVSSVWERQFVFNDRFFKDQGLDLKALSGVDRITWTKAFVLHVENELHELLRTTSWKMHRRADDSPVIRSNVREEWVDAFKFLVGLAQVWGFSPLELLEEFHRKSSVVEYRYKMERKLAAISPTDPVVAVDIDGVLNDYPASFLKWVAENPSSEDAHAAVASCERTLAGYRTALGPKAYAEAKDAYRESGAKREQGVRPGAKDLLDGLRAKGCTVVLLSKRPYWRIYRIYADTLQWLERNGLFADAVLFHREKHRAIMESFPNLVAMIEDDPKVAAEVRAAGVPVVLVRSELNEGHQDAVDGPAQALIKIKVPERKW